MTELWIASYLILWIVVAALCFIVTGLLRQLGLIQLRLGPEPGVLVTKEGLERGAAAPDFALVEARTRARVVLSALRGHRVLLVFLTPTCIACRQLLSHLNEVTQQRRDEFEVLTVCHGSGVTCKELAEAFRVQAPMLVDQANATAERYDVRLTPFGYLIDESGVVRLRGVVNSWPQLDALLEEEGTVSPVPWPQRPSELTDTETSADAVHETETQPV